MSCATSGKQSPKPGKIVSRALIDEQAVQDVIIIINRFSNPFSHEVNDELINICS